MQVPENTYEPRHSIGVALRRLFNDPFENSAQQFQLISTNEFNASCQSEQVKALVIQEGPSGYMLFTQLKRQVEFHALAVNNMIRTWSSLNSLIQFLHRHEVPLDEITIRLKKERPSK